MSNLKEKFLKQVITNKKKLDIHNDESDMIVDMDETSCSLEMSFDTTIDFTGKKI